MPVTTDVFVGADVDSKTTGRVTWFKGRKGDEPPRRRLRNLFAVERSFLEKHDRIVTRNTPPPMERAGGVF